MILQHEWRVVNGVRLHCVVAGSGPLIVLLHGFPEFWYSWRHQIPVLAQHFTVVAPDLRGYNTSDKPAHIADYRLATLVEDVIQLIHSFGKKSAIVAGHDWGGVIAWEIAIRHPEVVEKLIILNAPHPRIFIQHLLTNPRQLLRSWYIGFFQLPWLPEQAIKAGNYTVVERAFRGLAIRTDQFPDDVIEQYKGVLAQPGALTSAINYYRAAARRGLTNIGDNNPVVSVPTLVIWGQQDTALGLELNQGLERYVGDLTLHLIPDASHWVQQDRPDMVNQSIFDFLTDYIHHSA